MEIILGFVAGFMVSNIIDFFVRRCYRKGLQQTIEEYNNVTGMYKREIDRMKETPQTNLPIQANTIVIDENNADQFLDFIEKYGAVKKETIH